MTLALSNPTVSEVFKKYGWNTVGSSDCFASVAKKFVKEDGRALIAMYSRDLHDELIIINDESLLYETRGDWKNWSLSQLEERLIEDERIYKQYLKQIKIKQIMNEGKTLLNL